MSNVKKILDYFCVPTHDFGSSFPKLPYVHKTGITQTSDEFNIKVSPHLMWYMKLKTMDHFSRVPEHDLGILAKFPWIA